MCSLLLPPTVLPRLHDSTFRWWWCCCCCCHSSHKGSAHTDYKFYLSIVYVVFFFQLLYMEYSRILVPRRVNSLVRVNSRCLLLALCFQMLRDLWHGERNMAVHYICCNSPTRPGLCVNVFSEMRWMHQIYLEIVSFLDLRHEKSRNLINMQSWK